MTEETQTEDAVVAGNYKLVGTGTKNQGERVDRVVLEGTSSYPTKALNLGGEAVELTEDEVTRLRADGYEIKKQKDPSESSDDTEGDDEETADEAAAAQQKEQAATTGTAPRSEAPAGTTKGASKSTAPTKSN